MTNDKPYSKYARKMDRQLGAEYFNAGIDVDDFAMKDVRENLPPQRLGEFNHGYYAAKRAWEERNVT